jgi:DNA invertase Pin-like site-specific DNA recombinase
MGYTVEKWISDDGISGTVNYEKRKLGKLMKLTGKGDIVFVSEISRLARNLFLLFEILKYFSEKQIEMYTVKDNYKLDGTITSTVMAFAFGMAAQIERDMISKRTKEGLESRRRAGVVLGRPVGANSKAKKLDSKEEKIIEYLKKGLSYSAIARLTGTHRLTVAAICKEKGWDKYKALYPVSKEKVEKINLAAKNNPKHTAYTLKNIQMENDALLEMYRKNHFSLTAMSKELNIRSNSMKNLLKKQGIWDKIIEMNQSQRETCKSLCQIERETGNSRRNNKIQA